MDAKTNINSSLPVFIFFRTRYCDCFLTRGDLLWVCMMCHGLFYFFSDQERARRSAAQLRYLSSPFLSYLGTYIGRGFIVLEGIDPFSAPVSIVILSESGFF